MNNTKSLVTGMKPRYETKLEQVESENLKAYPKENVLCYDGLYMQTQLQHNNNNDNNIYIYIYLSILYIYIYI